MDQEQRLHGDGEEQGDEPGAVLQGLEAIEHGALISRAFGGRHAELGFRIRGATKQDLSAPK